MEISNNNHEAFVTAAPLFQSVPLVRPKTCAWRWRNGRQVYTAALSMSAMEMNTTAATLTTTVAATTTLTPPRITTPPVYTVVNPFEKESHPRRVMTPVSPVVIIPGYGAPASAYKRFRDSLAATLPSSTYVSVVPVTRREWAMTVGGRPMTPVLRLVDLAVRTALSETGASHVTLVGHSAGGWIGRVYLGDQPYPASHPTAVAWNGRRFVHQLVCLGTPHSSGEPVTRRNMSFVNFNYPGAFYNDVEYLNFAGDAVIVPPFAAPFWRWRIWHPLWMSRLSYKLTDPATRDDEPIVGDGTYYYICIHIYIFFFTLSLIFSLFRCFLSVKH